MSHSDDPAFALRRELVGFVDGTDRSRLAAARIESALAEDFAGDPRFTDLELALALYVPYGGDNEFLVDGDTLASECRLALGVIAELSESE
jgi:hypothetical protein